MEGTSKSITDIFGHKLRIRVCGICIKHNQILLVRHKGLGKEGAFWAPPGGGMVYGTTAAENLKREFEEETRLKIQVGTFLGVHEYLGPPLHTVELFFNVNITGGTLQLGTDPEMNENEQILDEVAFKDFNWILRNKGPKLHHLLNIASSSEDLVKFRGYFLRQNIK